VKSDGKVKPKVTIDLTQDKEEKEVVPNKRQTSAIQGEEVARAAGLISPCAPICQQPFHIFLVGELNTLKLDMAGTADWAQGQFIGNFKLHLLRIAPLDCPTSFRSFHLCFLRLR
jgi:hypothetical protein